MVSHIIITLGDVPAHMHAVKVKRLISLMSADTGTHLGFCPFRFCCELAGLKEGAGQFLSVNLPIKELK